MSSFCSAAIQRIEAGQRIDAAEAHGVVSGGADGHVGTAGGLMRARKHPEGVVSYIIDRNVNYTNVCVARCNFCAFYRSSDPPTATCCRSTRSSARSTRRIAVGGEQLLLQGGHNPDLPLEWYEDLFRAVKARYPSFKLHALSPSEILHISRLSKKPTAEVIARS